MANPWLRILLVDEDHSTRMNIEKNLASLGYHRVAPLSSLHELLVIIDSALCTFDLLIINEAVLKRAGPILDQGIRGYPDIRHSLIYQDASLHFSPFVDCSMSAMNFTLSGPPDRASINQVMNFIDKPACLRTTAKAPA
ncbi:histidine kinase [Pseudomonas sp. SDO5532_S415]|jgi:hypothetical protein